MRPPRDNMGAKGWVAKQPRLQPRRAAREAEGGEDNEWHRWEDGHYHSHCAKGKAEPSGGEVERAGEHRLYVGEFSREGKGDVAQLRIQHTELF